MKDISSRLTLFWIGLIVCALGAGLIYLGDGSPNAVNKGVVVSGVALTIGGIAILRYLLFAKKSK